MAAAIALASACQTAVSPETIVKIALVESRLEPFALHDNSDGRSYFPATRLEAFRLASALIAAGHRLDVGLTQINTANFPWLHLSLATALDPCMNIAASVTVLVGYSKYNTGSPSAGISNGYALKVQAVRADTDIGQPVTDIPAPPPPAPQETTVIDDEPAGPDGTTENSKQ